MISKDTLRALYEATKPQPDVVPHGWFRLMDVTAASGLGKTATSQRLTKGVRQGTLERRMFSVPRDGDSGPLQPIPFYRVKGKA